MHTIIRISVVAVLCFTGPVVFALPSDELKLDGLQFNDAHYHLTNYVQEGPTIQEYLRVMGTRVKRSTLFGIPLQQMWSHRLSGNVAPQYYLDTDAPLYYYSFVDAAIAMAYKSLPPEQQDRFDPMIIGFNPADMYAVDHIKRVLSLFPGVFTGIGEFTIHKEFVSAKTAGGPVGLTDPALDRLLDFAGEAGLVTLIHNDIQTPFNKDDKPPYYYEKLVELFKRHPKTNIIWAHLGLGRVIQPVKNQAALVEKILKDSALKHVYFDISWDELAKYLDATPESAQRVADTLNRYPDRFLFGTDEVALDNPRTHFKIVEDYASLWKLLSNETSQKIRLQNYERLFNAARTKVRAWEKANLKSPK